MDLLLKLDCISSSRLHLKLYAHANKNPYLVFSGIYRLNIHLALV